MQSVSRLGAALAFVVLASSGALAAEPVGKVATAKASVFSEPGGGNGIGREVSAGDPVFFLDKLSANATGIGEFIFDDGTKLAIGPNASLTVDRFVVKDQSTFQKFGVKATQGAFRWVSGSSPHSAYSLTTPLGTMGFRGTAVDVTNKDGITSIVLLNGGGQFCIEANCQKLDSSGDYITVDGKNISEPQDVRKAFKDRKAAGLIFPFLANPGLLSPMFQVPGSNLLSNMAMNGPGQGGGSTQAGNVATGPHLTGPLAGGPVTAAGSVTIFSLGAAAAAALSEMDDSEDPVTPF